MSCQQFVKTGGWQGLFEVRTPTTPELSNDSERLEKRLGEHRDRILRTTQTAEAAREAQRRRVSKDAGELETDLWQNRAGFGKHFVGFDSEWLAQQTRLPVGCKDGDNDSDGGNGGSGCEGELLEALTTIFRVVWHAKRSCTVDVAGLPALILVNSRDYSGKSAERPLHVDHKLRTMRRYIDVWKATLAYIWRTTDLESVSAAGQHTTTSAGL